MKASPILLAISSCVCIAACDAFEERRLREQIEIDLELKLSGTPKLLASEGYGWAEEGGDKALLRLAQEDCGLLSKVLGRPIRPSAKAGYLSMFHAHGFTPERVQLHWSQNAHMDYKSYALDVSSCTLYRQAHFE